MIILIEGPDGAGKTTLANKLADILHCENVHMSYPKTEEEKQQMFQQYLAIITSNSNKNIILDRCWYSEMVYGPVKREKSYISLGQMIQLEHCVNNNGGGFIIYCTGSAKDLYERSKIRGEDYINSSNELSVVVDLYEKIFRMRHSLPVLKYVI